MSDSTRRTVRTVLVVVLGISAALPIIVAESGIDLGSTPGLALIVAFAGLINRIVNTPQVDEVLTRVGLGKSPAPDGAHEALPQGEPVDDGGTLP